MSKVKILHCADIHFDSSFSELSELKAKARKEDIRETFSKIIKIAKEEKVQILLICGDIFDNISVTNNTIDFIIKKFQSLEDIYIFISPGNHDPYFEKSFYKMVKWPSNVHIFKETMEKVTIDKLKVNVYGQGFDKSHIKESLLEDVKIENDNYINLMVLHGDVVNIGTESLYNPIYEEQLKNSGIDYVALGHKHSFSGIQRSGNTYWAYSGNPEGRGFDEVGEKGVILGKVQKGFVNLNFVQTCKRTYNVYKVDVTGSNNYEDIILKINEALQLHNNKGNIQKINEAMLNNLYKIILIGKLNNDFSINVSILENKLSSQFYYLKIIDSTTIKIDFEALRNEFSLKGIFVKKIIDKINETEDENEKSHLQESLKFGIMALESKDVIEDEN